MSEMRDKQVTVPLSAELRRFVERAAAQEDRSLAGQIRHYLAEAARSHTAVRSVEGRRS